MVMFIEDLYLCGRVEETGEHSDFQMARTHQAATVLWTALLVSWTVTGYKNGKVEKACDTMVPGHGGHPNTTTSPYTLNVGTKTFKSGDHIKVNLSGLQHFEGFLIEARDTEDPAGLAVGSFTLISPEISQLLQCHSIKGSAVSHTSNTKLTEVGVVWTAPADAPPTVHFMATVVAHYSNFWVKIPSPVITQDGVTPNPTTPTTFTSASTETTAVLPQPFSSDGCGQEKSCLLDPVHCNPATDTHCFFLSYRTEGSSVQFELSGPAPGYVSFALSEDKWMGNDDVYLCVNDGGRVSVEAAYATGRTHPEIADKAELSDVGWRVADGVIQCRFRRAISIPEDPQRFSLNHSYYLFIAHGAAEDGLIHKHKRQPLISAQRQAITGPPEIATGSRSPLMMKYHGALMLFAWMVLGSTGIFMAGFFKPDWPEKTLFGQRIWFMVHHSLMMLTVIFTFVGFILPFIYRGHWSRGASAHAGLGCTVMSLTVIQPIMAFFRPSPDSSRRWIFNWMHRGVGKTAELLAGITISYGMHQQSLLLPFPWTTGVFVGFIILVILSKVILFVYRRNICKPGAERPDELAILSDSSVSKGWDTKLKVVILAAFVGVNCLFCTALLCSISAI
ncbi:putative ferric-chelate reductase 1 [Astyanax mexicanus]|uniref:putative ferric-chelate reductase 1 n=1 Tax=Astyanax mexicanus TaxID=7994 RepID=UPI0020CB39F3|nr:putative ferric-chelate reductase 1 [Astyanax mexicanus]